MILEFNSKFDLTNINDSMELDSGQTVAQLRIKLDADNPNHDDTDVLITLEVQGDVKVFYKNEMYKCASQMPDELIKIFHDGYEDPEAIGLNVCENNWFEIYIEEDGQCVLSDVACPEGMNNIEMLSMMLDVYKEYVKEFKTISDGNAPATTNAH